MNDEARIRRLRWMCRRGMKELDVLLELFLLASESELCAGRWPQFERLLELEDDVLWNRLRGPGRSPDPALDELIGAIRGTKRRGA